MFKKIEGIYTAAKQAFKKNPNPGAAIKSVKTNVPDTKLKKLQAANKIATQRLKGAQAKLKQTNFELANKAFKKDDKFTFARDKKKTESNKEAYKRIQKENTESIKKMIDTAFAENKAKGGRVGLKGGGNLGMQSVKYGLDNKPEITKLDRIAKFIAKDKKKKNKTPMDKAVKKDKKKKRFV
jgi:hypothetical protein